MSKYPEPIRILCVDDEPNVLRALERIFLDDDYKIVPAGSGDEGLEILQESDPFQVIISDYRMPHMNGVEFLGAVYDRWPETVRIVLSGYADAGAVVAAINEGHIYKFIPKPWNENELRITIQDSLERFFLQKKNKELLGELARINQALEEKVRRRTEQLELRNRALEFSQNLLSNLPVGVVGIDMNGMVAYCNDIAAGLLKKVCGGDIFGADLDTCCEPLGSLVKKVRNENYISVQTKLGDTSCWIYGRTMAFCDIESIALVFLEVKE